MKLTGTAEMGYPGLADDTMTGQWYRQDPDGTLIEGEWSTVHLNQQSAEPPEITPEHPLYFRGDLKIHLFGAGGTTPIEQRNPLLAFDLISNIVMDNVRVTFPDSTSVTLQPYTDVFSPDVDWVTHFRFVHNIPGLPTQGTPYIFDALNVAGNPISGVETADLWVGVEPPDPPTNVQAEVIEMGIQASWDPVSVVVGSFEPAKGIGWYQMEIYNVSHEAVYGASAIDTPSHIIPKAREDLQPGRDWGLPIGEMDDGTYTLEVNVHSVAPDASAGSGIEYSSRNPDEYITFEITNGLVIIP
jgi:hypothetical protein